jgi:hypothetical protein
VLPLTIALVTVYLVWAVPPTVIAYRRRKRSESKAPEDLPSYTVGLAGRMMRTWQRLGGIGTPEPLHLTQRRSGERPLSQSVRGLRGCMGTPSPKPSN